MILITDAGGGCIDTFLIQVDINTQTQKNIIIVKDLLLKT